jgi:hypothetical protein
VPLFAAAQLIPAQPFRSVASAVAQKMAATVPMLNLFAVN